MASIRKKLRFLYQHPFSVQEITPDQRNERVQFATDILRDAPEDAVIIFTDESRFCLGPDNTFRYICRGEWNSTAFAEKQKYSKGYMYWGAIGRNFKSRLIRCPVTMNMDGYIQVLQDSGLFPILSEMFGKHQYYFMQDGAPCHLASDSLTWINNRAKILPGWPPNSPNLNAIETVWAVVKRRIKSRDVHDLDRLDQTVMQTWEELGMNTINILVSDFRRRLKLVIDADGNSISAHLSSHKKIFQTVEEAVEALRLFEDQEDQELLRLHEAYGNQWKRIAQIVENRNEHQIRHRI